ncbi:MAG: response regulator, partial [Magnetococcales bacterium]|nr:response regulator [Magnetococcales bacterium]
MSTHALPPRTILLVDDIPDNITLLTEMLNPFYRTRIATQGATALRIAATPPLPDLILLDIMMPGMDGYEVCRRLKETPDTRR